MRWTTYLPLVAICCLSATSSVLAVPGFSFERYNNQASTLDKTVGLKGNGTISAGRKTSCRVHTSHLKRSKAMKKLTRMRKSEKDDGHNITIRVHMHIIREDDTAEGGNINDRQIKAQMNLLNKAYEPANVQFNLEETTRTKNKDWFENVDMFNKQEQKMKKKLRKGGAADMNVYTVKLDENSFGYATFPDEYEDDEDSDGVVINYRTLPDGSIEGYNLGATLVHEAGHWVGLYHTFVEEEDRDEDACSGDGDFVDDTPPQLEPTHGCEEQDTCVNEAGVDNWNNYMDYSEDRCMQDFTPGQATRLRLQLQTYREIDV